MRDARHHDRHGRARDRRLELITGSKRRRARSAREKAAIVAETFAPGANVPEDCAPPRPQPRPAVYLASAGQESTSQSGRGGHI